MRKDALFRLLIVVDFVLAILTIGVEIALGSTLPKPLHDYVQRSWFDFSAGSVVLFFFSAGVICATTISWVGLFLYWWPARAIYVGAWMVWLVLLVAAGPSVMTGAGAALHTAEAVIGGVLIAMMFFNAEVAARFDESELEPAPAA